jgi:hypothetical protein
MNKIYTLMFAVLLTVTLISLVSADKVVVAGKIYENNYADTVSGASVNVTCGDLLGSTTSLGDGAYVVKFDEDTTCHENATVSVFAVSDGMTGTNSGEVHDGALLGLDCPLDFAVVNVNLIPEFGLLIGTITVISAIAVFFIIRRK